MFLFNVTGPRTHRADGPLNTELVALPQNNNPPTRRHSSGNDNFRSGFTAAQILAGDSGSAFLTDFERRILEAINLASQERRISERTADFVRKLIFNPDFRSNIVARYWGQEVADSLAERRRNGDRRTQQAGMLAALVAIPEPTQLIGAIKAIQGELLDELKGMAADMLANARDLAEWFARTRARHGDTRDAFALAQAQGRGVPDIVGNIVTFLSDPTLSYNPSQILVDAQSTAATVNRRNRTRREVRELESVVANADPNNPTQAQADARRRLPDLRNNITSA